MWLEVVLLLVVAFLFREWYWKRRHLPRGPLPLPVIGNMLSIMRNPPGMAAYQSWKDKFGAVYSYWLGSIPIITVNDYETMVEMFVKDGDNYVDRQPLGDLEQQFREGEYGLVQTNGPVWREQRRFALHTLRDIGLGKPRMQERILLEAECLMAELEEESKSGGVQLNKKLDRTVASVINLVVFGYRFDEERAHEFYKMREDGEEMIKKLQNPIIIASLLTPWLRKLPFISQRFQDLKDFQVTAMEFFKRNIDEHRAVIDYSNDDAEDLAEAFLKEQHRQRDDPDTTFTDKQLQFLCVDLWSAGLETTTGTMAWGTLHLLHNPHVQKRMQDEFDRVIGTDRLITINDKPNLPYTSAVISECQRWITIVTQNLLRKNTREVTVNGQTIPAGSPVSPQISMLLYDPAVYPDPDKFNPDRFLDEKGNYFQHKQFLPFSLGKRACPGEGLAKMELFLFFSNIVHRFTMAPDPSEPLHPAVRTLKTSAKPDPFKCILTRRRINV